LFPYARNHLREFLDRHQHDAEVMNDLQKLEAERKGDEVRGLNPPEWRGGSSESNLSSAAFYAQWLMDRDRKSTALKSLQGKVWQAGYESGELRGQVYPDIPPCALASAEPEGVHFFFWKHSRPETALRTHHSRRSDAVYQRLF